MKFSVKIAVVSLAAMLALGSAAQAATTIVVAGSDATGALLERMGRRFADLVEKKSGGQISPKFIAGQSLGSAQQVMEQHQAGSVDVFFSRPDWFTTNVKDFQVLTWGFTFRDREHLKKFLSSPIFDGLRQQAVDKMGVRILAAAADQPRILYSRSAIKGVEDLKGLKMRVPGIKAYLELWSELGTVPTQIAWAEAFLALQTGGVSAAEADASGAYSQKFHIAAPFITRTNHLISAATLSINEAKWKSLSDKDKAVVQEAAQEALAWMSEEALKDSEVTLAKMAKEGATVIDVKNEPFAEKASAGVKRMEAEGLWSAGLWQRIRDL
jgi:TRAP-type C4-dicarboxylate transport system substrate-binding protein